MSTTALACTAQAKCEAGAHLGGHAGKQQVRDMAGLQPVLELRRVEGALARLEQLQLTLRMVVKSMITGLSVRMSRAGCRVAARYCRGAMVCD